MRPSRSINYESTKQARRRRRERWKRKPGETRVSSLKNFLGRMRVRTQEETAKILGISRQRVQQLERMAIWKIRQRLSDYE
jgi:DNA-directed RNA polymerase sigma subunit (sigma70/sigma32)